MRKKKRKKSTKIRRFFHLKSDPWGKKEKERIYRESSKKKKRYSHLQSYYSWIIKKKEA